VVLQQTLLDVTILQKITFQFTAPNTPQHNGRVESKFSIIYDKIRSVMNAAGIMDDMRKLLWAEAANQSTDVINTLITTTYSKPPYALFYGTSSLMINTCDNLVKWQLQIILKQKKCPVNCQIKIFLAFI
jgi:hypothetical protein